MLDSKDTAIVINREVTDAEAVKFRHNGTEECRL
jgi:hypothetical protein